MHEKIEWFDSNETTCSMNYIWYFDRQIISVMQKYHNLLPKVAQYITVTKPCILKVTFKITVKINIQMFSEKDRQSDWSSIDFMGYNETQHPNEIDINWWKVSMSFHALPKQE